MNTVTTTKTSEKMSKADIIQQKIWKAFGKVSKSLGYDCDIYHSQHLDSPIQEANNVFEGKVAFSLDDNFGATPKDGLNLFKCWVDGRYANIFDVEAGDHIKRVKDDAIFYIANADEHHRLTAIKCNATISVQRVVYGDSGQGYGPSDTEVADTIPCFIKIGSAKGGNLGYIPANTNSEETLQTAMIYLWDARNEIHVQDAIEDDMSRRWQVKAIEKSEIGTKLVVQEYSAS